MTLHSDLVKEKQREIERKWKRDTVEERERGKKR